LLTATSQVQKFSHSNMSARAASSRLYFEEKEYQMPDVNSNQSQPVPPVPVPPPQPDQTPANPTAPVPGSTEDLEKKALQSRMSPPQQAPSAFQNQNPQNPNPAQRPSLHARVFDRILKGMTGGDVKVVRPDGSVDTVPQSRASMGRAIVAAALTGLMTPTHYRETPYGPANDFAADMSGAAQAAKGSMEAWRNQPQQLSDEQQARRLMTTSNNAKLLQLKMSMAQMQHARMEDSKTEIADFLKPFNDYQEEKSNDQPDAFLKKGMTHEQALAEAKNPGSGLTEANFVQDGWIPAGFDPETHEQQWQPSYAVINPALKDIKLSPEVANRLAEMNSQFQDIHKIVGGDVRLPINPFVSAMHDYEALTSAEHILDRLNESLHPDEAKAGTLQGVNLAPIVKNSTNRPQLIQALYGLHQTIASGVTGLGKGTTQNPAQPTEGENPAHVLSVLLNQAPELLKPLGLSTADAEDRINNWRAVQQEIKNQGTPKAPALPKQVQDLKTAVAQLPDADQKEMAPLVKDNMSAGEITKAQGALARINSRNQASQIRQALAGGDPATIAQFSKNVVEGDVNSLKMLPARGDSRLKAVNQLHAEAEARGLDTTKYTEPALQAKSNMLEDYAGNKRGSTGAQITSFNAFLGHTAAAYDATERLKDKTLGSTGLPVVNQGLKVLGKQLANDADWKAYQTALQPVKQEISNFLAAGYAPQADEQAAISRVLDENETPERIEAALKQLADTADVRLTAMGQKYLNTMDTTYPTLLNADAANTLKKLGIQSKAAAVSGRLSKGWQNNQASPASADVVKRFYAATGGDKQRTAELLKANGWAGF
jgi:hypothetical protein